MPSITAPGIGSGLDIAGLVDQLVAAERAPVENRLNAQEAEANAQLSAFGRLTSVLAEFRTTAELLKGVGGFGQRSVTSDDEAIVTATASPGAPLGTFNVEVISLASAHRLASEAYTDGNAVVGTGTLTIEVNGESMDIELVDGANTLADLRIAINDAEDNPGVTATIVNAEDGAHLVISADSSGADNEISVSRSGADKDLRDFVKDLEEQRSAADAELRIDDFTVFSPDNEVSGAIEGVVFSLHDAVPGQIAEISIGKDLDSTRASVESFIDAWNTMQDTFRELTAYDQTSDIAGDLLGDSLMRGLSTSLRRELSTVLDSGTFRMLADIGVETTVEGDLSLNTARFDDALATDFDAVGELFQGDAGLAGRLDVLLGSYLNPDGQIENREESLQEELNTIEDQRFALDARMESVRARYELQFSAMDALVAQLQATGDFLTQQLAALPGYGS